MPAPLVFLDIAGQTDKSLAAFYTANFDWDVDESGHFSTHLVPLSDKPLAINGAFRDDPKETILYFGVDSIADTLSRVTENGGTIDKPRFEVPSVVVLGLFFDPAGNRIGLVELESGKLKVP